MSRGGTSRGILVRLPDARVVGYTEPSDSVRHSIYQRTSLRVVPLRYVLVQEGRVAKQCIRGIGRVDEELVREKLMMRNIVWVSMSEAAMR